jgi:hypothetical protein
MKVSMMTASLLMVLAAGTATLGTVEASTAPSGSPKTSPLDETAKVADVNETPPDPCEITSGPSPDYSEFWNLKPGKQFTMVNRSGLRYRIKLKVLFPGEIGDPNYFLINTDMAPIGSGPCENGDISQGQFAFAIHPLSNPHKPNDPKSLHALIYIPVVKNINKNAGLPDEFFLIVLSIKDKKICEAETDPIEMKRCQALRNLADLQTTSPMDYLFIRAVKDNIGAILAHHQKTDGLPKTPAAREAITNHNGIIHGTLQ